MCVVAIGVSYGTIGMWFSPRVGDRVVPPQQKRQKHVNAS
jgi:hypothetical protein